MICEIDGWVLEGMQFGVLVRMTFVGGADDRRSLARLCESDGGVLGRLQCGMLAQLLLWGVGFCKIDGRVLGMQFGVPQVLFRDAGWGAVGGVRTRLSVLWCWLFRSSGRGVLLEVLVCNSLFWLSGVYAGVIV